MQTLVDVIKSDHRLSSVAQTMNEARLMLTEVAGPSGPSEGEVR